MQIEETKKPNKNYFNDDTELAIVEYLSCTDTIERNRIYNTRISYAFNKLAENIIHTYKFYYYENSYEDFKHELVTMFLEKLHKFNPELGKAYSYFTRSAINYCTVHNKSNYKNIMTVDSIETGIELDTEDTPLQLIQPEPNGDIEMISTIFIDFLEKKITTIFHKKMDIQIAEAILLIFKRRSNVDNFNKKAIYILVREICDTTTNDITRVLTILKKYFYIIMNEYHNNGHVEPDDIV